MSPQKIQKGSINESVTTQTEQFIPPPPPPQPPPPPPPKSKKNKKKVILITTVVFVIIWSILLTALLYPLILDNETIDNKGYDEDFIIKMNALDNMDVDIQREYLSYFAMRFRNIIDNVSGNDDDIVLLSEVEDFEKYKKQVNEGQFTFDFIIDFYKGKYSYYDTSIEDAIGEVQSDSPILQDISCNLVWPNMKKHRDAYQIRVSNYEYFTDFRFIAPPGFEIRKVYGLKNITYEKENTTITGNINTERFWDFETIYITIVRLDVEDFGYYADREPNNDFNSAYPISSGGLIYGDLEDDIDEYDYYQIYLSRSGDINVSVWGPELISFGLSLYDVYGNPIKGIYSGGNFVSIEHSSFMHGNFYVKVSIHNGRCDYYLDVVITD
jgi:hypothetical protein